MSELAAWANDHTQRDMLDYNPHSIAAFRRWLNSGTTATSPN